MEKVLALYDSDVFYVSRFMEYFNRREDYHFEVSAFTKRESLNEYLTAHAIEILLLGSSFADESFAGSNIKYIYYLSETTSVPKNNDMPGVFKYQPAQAVISEIMTDYQRREYETHAVGCGSVRIISIFSPIPSIEKLSFAWSLSTLMSEQKKVLLVLLDPLPVQLVFPIDNSGQPLTEFIYYLKEKTNAITKMKSLLGLSGNLTYLSGVTHGSDIFSLNKEDIDSWVEELKEHTDYQAVIFYLGCYAEASIELMNLSDTIIAAMMEDPYEMAVVKEWERQMDCIGMSTNQDKYHHIELQKENRPEVVSISLSDLIKYASWETAEQYLKQWKPGGLNG